jgi:UDP-N-acetylglucosamine transferase subunit ALG13/SAM-dependent methyltransferase
MPALEFSKQGAGRNGRLKVLVTVGMTSWPFDRLMAAVERLCPEHDVVAQIGPARIRPPCRHERYVPLPELLDLLDEADVVVTHAGNTVRLVQRRGKAPVVVARRAALGEMANDHQVEFLLEEERARSVVAVWDVANLTKVVRTYSNGRREPGIRALSPPSTDKHIATVMQTIEDELVMDPFRQHPIRRYSYAWRALRGVAGPHIDVGCGGGVFLGPFGATTGRWVVGVDPHPGYLAHLERSHPDLCLVRVSTRGPLPFRDGSFASATLLDVLEHSVDESQLLADTHRVLQPDARVVVTVPAHFALDALDPDNLKYRFPWTHRVIYAGRFGRQVYRRRFEDLADGLRGDIAVERRCHRHYDESELDALLTKTGFEVLSARRSGLLSNLMNAGAEVAGGSIRSFLGRLIELDADLFASANLFVIARRLP